MGNKFIAKCGGRYKINSMGENKDYDPGVYRRLQLVQKQFKTTTEEQKRAQAAEKRQALWQNVRQNKILIGRIALYSVLGLVLAAVILVLIFART